MVIANLSESSTQEQPWSHSQVSMYLSMNHLEGPRTSPENAGRLGFAAELLNEQRPLRIVPCLGPKVLDTLLPVLAEIVKPQAIFLRVNRIDQPAFQLHPLSWIDQALENRVLYPLAAILAELGHVPKPALTIGRFRVHIVSD